jgi:hypothetical protein
VFKWLVDLFAGMSAPKGVFVGRQRTRDVAFAFRMGAGFPGDVNRGHPASIEPVLIDAAAPPTAYGQPVLVDPTTDGVRPFTTTDTAITSIWGVTVRPFPMQASTGTAYGGAAFGAATPPTSGALDVLRSGYIMSTALPAGSAIVSKGSPVFVWCAASSGAHIQGGIEAAAVGGSTAALDPNRYQFNGPADALGNVELSINV